MFVCGKNYYDRACEWVGWTCGDSLLDFWTKKSRSWLYVIRFSRRDGFLDGRLLKHIYFVGVQLCAK